MKRHFLLLVAMVVFATAFTTNVSGQTGKTVRANVKFDFQIGDRVYPAGEYRIESVGQPENILRIISVGDVKKTQFILANHSNAGKTQAPRLVFDNYGGNYFLTKIVLESGQWGYSLNPSRHQRHSKRNLASGFPSKRLQVVTLPNRSH